MQAENRDAWDLAAEKYAATVEADIEFLRRGGVSLLPIEEQVIGQLSSCNRVVHLQCSHGLDTLSLLNMGASQVIGLDFSPAMLALARQKSERLDAAAQWLCEDVLAPPQWLFGTADLVYTGKGALPWVEHIGVWASGVARLLKPGGALFLLEGHPLNWVWRSDSHTHQLDATSRGYFDESPRANTDFPASAVQRFAQRGAVAPTARERQWNIGQVVSSLAEAGLQIERLIELPEHYWPQFPNIPPSELVRLPHSYALRARAAA